MNLIKSIQYFIAKQKKIDLNECIIGNFHIKFKFCMLTSVGLLVYIPF